MMNTNSYCASQFRSIFPVALQILLAMTIVGCSPDDGAGESRRTLNRGLTGDPESLDPHLYTSTQAATVLRDLREGLVSYSRDGDLIGGMASHWTVSGDQLEYRFAIRSDARWSNGQPVTASDFVRSYRRLISSSVGSPSAKDLSMIENANRILSGEVPDRELAVVAINEQILSIKLESATPYFLQLLTHPSTFPIYFARVGADNGEKLQPALGITNGPYLLNDRVLGSTLTLIRNEHYWNDVGTWFEKVVYHSLSPSVEVLRYRAGDLDMTSSVDPGSFELVKRELSNELKVDPYLGIYYYGFNLKKAPFKNADALRKALSMAIDRTAIVESVTGRGERPAYTLVPPGVENYESAEVDFSNLSQRQREEMAKQLYASAGYGPQNPLKFELRYNTSGGHEKIAVAIQSMWRQVLGAEARLVGEEFKVFIENVMDMKVTEAFRLSWIGDYNDPYAFLQLIESGNANNLTGYSNFEVDDLLRNAAASSDSVARRGYLREAERLALDDHVIIPIYFYVSKHLVKRDIAGWRPNILDIHLSKFLSRSEASGL